MLKSKKNSELTQPPAMTSPHKGISPFEFVNLSRTRSFICKVKKKKNMLYLENGCHSKILQRLLGTI